MVLHHVPQRAGHVIIMGAVLHPDGLGHGDLDVVDVSLVPQGLENRVAEAHHQEILDKLLGEVVVDAVDLALVEDREDGPVEPFRGAEVAAEGLLEHHPGVAAPLRLLGEACLLHALHHGADELRRDGQVEDAVDGRAVRPCHALETLLEEGIVLFLREMEGSIGDPS